MTAPKDTKDTAGTASDKDAAQGAGGTGGAAQAGTSTSTDGKDAKDSTKDTAGKDAALGKSHAANASTSARSGSGKVAKDDKPANTGKIVHRHNEVRANRTDREAQIARADEHMRRAASDDSDGAKVLADKYEAEEAKYADHDNLPPPTGKAFDTLTPARIDGDGTRHW